MHYCVTDIRSLSFDLWVTKFWMFRAPHSSKMKDQNKATLTFGRKPRSPAAKSCVWPIPPPPTTPDTDFPGQVPPKMVVCIYNPVQQHHKVQLGWISRKNCYFLRKWQIFRCDRVQDKCQFHRRSLYCMYVVLHVNRLCKNWNSAGEGIKTPSEGNRSFVQINNAAFSQLSSLSAAITGVT